MIPGFCKNELNQEIISFCIFQRNISENQISNQPKTNVPTENKREEDLTDFLGVLESTASKLLHPVKDRPKHPKTRPTPSVVGACAAVQSEKATKITPTKKGIY